MHPIPSISKEKATRELIISCDFYLARKIGRILKIKFPKYDFWAVSENSNDGLYTGVNIPNDDFYTILGYASAIRDTHNNLFGE